MTKVTIIKNYRNNITLRQLDLSEVVQAIQGQTYEELCEQLRHVYPLVEVRQKYDAMDGLIDLYTKDLPKVCFTSQMENRNKQRIIRAYNGLVLLEVNNLAGFEEAEAVRKGASQIPHTLLTFVGASGRSVKIVCCGAHPRPLLPPKGRSVARNPTGGESGKKEEGRSQKEEGRCKREEGRCLM